MLRQIAIFTLFLLTVALPAAQVVRVDAATVNGTYDTGTSIDIVVHFNGPVSTTVGTTRLLLSVGRAAGDEAYAYANVAQSNVNDITLSYLVQTSDNSIDLDYSSITALSGVTGMVGNLPTPGAINSLSNLANLIIDTAPIVYSVSTSLATGTYGVGQVVPITVQFSEPVTVASSTGVKLLLQLNGNTKNVDCTSGTGSTLLFNYTVGASEDVTSLDYASTTALTLTGISTVKDNDGTSTNAVLTLPFGGSSSLRNIRIDATAPTITDITSTAANGSYKAGDSLPITVQFSEPVNVVGTPTISLNTIPAATATYTSGTGTTSLVFTYAVAGAQVISDLDVNALTVPALSSIADAAGNGVVTQTVTSTSLATNKNIRIALVPAVTSVTGTPTTTAGLNSLVTITVTLDSADIVIGSGATLTLETGATDRAVALTSVTPTTLVFTYTVQAGDVSPRLDYTSINALTLGNVKINGFSGLVLTLPSVGGSHALYQSNIQVDTTTSGVPVLTTVQVGPSNTAPITVAISASEPVVNFVDADLTVTNGSATVTPVASSNNFIASLTPQSPLFMNAVQPNALQLVLRARGTAINLIKGQAIKIGANTTFIDSAISVSTSSDTTVTLTTPLPLGLSAGIDVWQATGVAMDLSIPVNAVQDLAGNNNAAVAVKQFVYDPMAPIATILVPSSSISPYQFTVSFNEAVSTPLAASFTAVGGTVGTVTNSVVGTAWTVNVAPTTTGGTVSLTLNANAVVDQAGNANLASATVGFAALVVTKIEAAPTTAKSYHPGDTVTLIATLNHAAAFATGTAIPTLALQTGTTPALANLTSPSTTATDTLTFTYTVGSSDSSSDLDVVSATALDLNGRTIDGLTTLKVPAPGAADSLSVTSAVTIDSTKPTVTFDDPTVTGPLKALLTVRFNEPIAASGTGTLEASDFTVPAGVTAGTPVLSVDGRSATVALTLPVSASTASAETTYLVTLKASAVTDVAGNVSTDTPSGTITYNPQIPVLTLKTTPGDKSTAPLSITIDSTKYVTGMAIDDLGCTNAQASAISASVGTSFTASLTPKANLVLGQPAALGVSTINLQAVDGDVGVPAGTVLRLVNTGVSTTVVRLTTTAATTVTKTGTNVGIASGLPALFPTGAEVWLADGLIVTMIVKADSCVDVMGGHNVASDPISVRYDPTPPMFRITAPTKLQANGSAIFTLTPSERVINLEKAGLTATNGTITAVSEAADHKTWEATVTPSDATSVGLSVNANAAIDLAGNPSLAEPAASMIIKPYVTKVTCKNTNGTYGSGIHLQVVVTFNEAVTVVGTPSLLLNLTATGKKAIYGSTASNELVFDYTTVDGDQTTDLDYLSATSLALEGATIKDASSGAADLTLPAPAASGSLAANAAIVVNTSGPTGPGKPEPGDNPSAGAGGCGAGSGIALILVGGWLGLSFSRRRRAA